MATGTTRFLTNYAQGTATVAVQGMTVDPNFPATNMTKADRYVVTSFLAGAAGTGTVIIDTALTVTAAVVGALGLNRPQGGPNVFACAYAPGSPTKTVSGVTLTGNALTRSSGDFVADGITVGMLVTLGGLPTCTTVLAVTTTTCTLSQSGTGSGTASFFAWTTTNGFSGTGSNLYALTSTPPSARWWRFTMSSAGNKSWSVSRFLIGTIAFDTGMMFSAGTTDKLVRNRVTGQTANGVYVRSEVGLPFREVALQFNAVTETTRAALYSYILAAPFTMLDAYGRLDDCDATDDTMIATVRWGSPDLYDVAFNIRTLP